LASNGRRDVRERRGTVDGVQFDRLTRGLARVATRRGVLGGAVAGLLGAVAFETSVDAAERRRTVCRELSTPCTRDGQCCSGICQRSSRGVGRSSRYQCSCRPGLTACGRTCHDLRTDPENCGACGVVCDSGECVDGACVEPLLECVGALPLGSACTKGGECCSLSCLNGVCSAPSVDCATWTTTNGSESCYRLNNETLGSVLHSPRDLVCKSTMGSSSNFACQSNDDCEAHVSTFAPEPVRGVCLADIYECFPNCADILSTPTCLFFYRVDEACP